MEACFMNELCFRVLDVIANNFESPSIIEERIPPGIGREIAKVQLRRGNVSGKVLTLACRCRLEELSLEGVTLSEAIVGKLLNMSGHLQSVRLRMIQISLTGTRICAIHSGVCHEVIYGVVVAEMLEFLIGVVVLSLFQISFYYLNPFRISDFSKFSIVRLLMMN